MLAVLPARAYTLAMMGAEALVPPKTSQPDRPCVRVVSYTATPVFGSATADTSATARLPHPVTAGFCALRIALSVEQPEPAPLHAASVQPRLFDARVSDVPPTAVTERDDAGHSP